MQVFAMLIGYDNTKWTYLFNDMPISHSSKQNIYAHIRSWTKF